MYVCESSTATDLGEHVVQATQCAFRHAEGVVQERLLDGRITRESLRWSSQSDRTRRDKLQCPTDSRLQASELGSGGWARLC